MPRVTTTLEVAYVPVGSVCPEGFTPTGRTIGSRTPNPQTVCVKKTDGTAVTKSDMDDLAAAFGGLGMHAEGAASTGWGGEGPMNQVGGRRHHRKSHKAGRKGASRRSKSRKAGRKSRRHSHRQH